MSSINNKKLSIQISLSGLSFCILNTASNTIEHLQYDNFDKKATPFEVLERLITILETNTRFSQAFDAVLLIYQNELSNLVPKSLFKPENAAEYLKFNTKILKTDYVTFDDILINNSVNVYIPLVNINNYIFDTFGAFEYKHAATILLETLLLKESNATDTKVYINVSHDHFELIIIDQGALMLYNTFEYHSKEDFIYFILFSLEQLQLDQEKIKVVFSGNIEKDDELYQIVYKYIRFVDFMPSAIGFKFLPYAQPKQDYHNFIILNSFK